MSAIPPATSKALESIVRGTRGRGAAAVFLFGRFKMRRNDTSALVDHKIYARLWSDFRATKKLRIFSADH
jgi:hypothetical protein